MHIKKNVTKVKNKITKTATAVSTAVTMIIISAMIEVNAAVNFSGGVNQVANEVKSQGKTIAATVFGAIAIFALAFTVAKGIKTAFAYRRGEDVHMGPVIAGGVGTIVAGLASAATFFSWFGL